MKSLRVFSCLVACPIISLVSAAPSTEPWMATHIGEVKWSAAVLGNDAISIAWPADDHRTVRITNHLGPKPESIDFAPFQLVFRDDHTVTADSMQLMKKPERIDLETVGGPNLGGHFKGHGLVMMLQDSDSGLEVRWTVELRSGANYAQERLELFPRSKDINVSKVVLLDAEAPGAKVIGTAQGSPVATDAWFFGFEHPLSSSKVDDDHFTCSIDRKLPLRRGQTTIYTAVVGVAPAGQLRRAFLRYVERERAHPYRPFLHYNCWYDLGMDKLYDEAECLDRIHRFGEELAKKRNVRLSSYLFDDGWDNTSTTWEFASGMPRGFRPLARVAAEYGAGAGIWLSPWGGYSRRRAERLAAGKKNGFEIDSEGLALSGPKYYARFREVCLDLLKQGVNQFKFDGTGSPDKQYPGSAFGSDFEAAIALIGDLRKAKPDLFVNMTTGTWPSPFWVQYADSIWRGGYDHSFAGVGTKRQQWITYRDGDTYERVVQPGPLYPLNSLMLHGLIYAKFAQNLGNDPGDDFASDVHAYFGTGTQLQELYITPTLLTEKNWDDLAEAAKWSRENADVLRDVHWVGGNPLKLEVYGHAAWNGSKGMLVLRNPSDKPQEISVDVSSAFELPTDKQYGFSAASPWLTEKDAAARRFVSGQSQTVALAPFQVVTLDMTLLTR